MNARSGPVAMAVYPAVAASTTLPLPLNDLTTIFETIVASQSCFRIESNIEVTGARKWYLNNCFSVYFSERVPSAWNPATGIVCRETKSFLLIASSYFSFALSFLLK